MRTLISQVLITTSTNNRSLDLENFTFVFVFSTFSVIDQESGFGNNFFGLVGPLFYTLFLLQKQHHSNQVTYVMNFLKLILCFQNWLNALLLIEVLERKARSLVYMVVTYAAEALKSPFCVLYRPTDTHPSSRQEMHPYKYWSSAIRTHAPRVPNTFK